MTDALGVPHSSRRSSRPGRVVESRQSCAFTGPLDHDGQHALALYPGSSGCIALRDRLLFDSAQQLPMTATIAPDALPVREHRIPGPHIYIRCGTWRATGNLKTPDSSLT